jgi:hypothetical protein
MTKQAAGMESQYRIDRDRGTKDSAQQFPMSRAKVCASKAAGQGGCRRHNDHYDNDNQNDGEDRDGPIGTDGNPRPNIGSLFRNLKPPAHQFAYDVEDLTGAHRLLLSR